MSNKSRKVVSMRGEVVDFDLFAIKEQLNEAPVTETIEDRHRFINLRRKRGTKRMLQDMVSQQADNERNVEDAIQRKRQSKTADVDAEPTTEKDEPTVRKIQKRTNNDNA